LVKEAGRKKVGERVTYSSDHKQKGDRQNYEKTAKVILLKARERSIFGAVRSSKTKNGTD